VYYPAGNWKFVLSLKMTASSDNALGAFKMQITQPIFNLSVVQLPFNG
jgi:hypothetical protein